MKAKLLSRWGADKGVEHVFSAETTIGRGTENRLRLKARAVSKHHARIYFDGERGAYFLEDLGSANGTELDGIPVTRAQRLRSLQHLRFAGLAEFLFVEIDRRPEDLNEEAGPQTMIMENAFELPAVPLAARQEQPEPATRVEDIPVVLPEVLIKPGDPPPPAPRPGAKQATDFILELRDEEEIRRFELRSGENVIGRAQEAAIRLSSPELSRLHAVLILSAGRVTLRDLGSSNHTFVAGKEIDTEVEIRPGTAFRFGQLEARLLRRGETVDTKPREKP